MDIWNYIDKILQIHPEFSEYELEEFCNDYISKFNKKTKESTKEKSLRRYLEKEFNIKFDSPETKVEDNLFWDLNSIPKRFFQSGQKLDANDYIVNIQNLNKQIWKTVIFQWASLKIRANEKLALVGKNWVWKSSLLRILIWEDEDDFQSVRISKSVKIWFLSQDIFWENSERTLKDEMLTCFPEITRSIEALVELEKKLSSNSWVSTDLIQRYNNIAEKLKKENWYKKYADQTDILKFFGFWEDHLDLKISQLSWGEQTRVQIAKFLLLDVNLLILDEPTNHLDIDWIIFLEKICKLWERSLICISHDKKFLNNIFSEIIEISNRKMYRYNWNYDEYKLQKHKNYELDLRKFENQQKYLKEQNTFIERFRYKASKASQVQSRIKLLNKMEIFDKPELWVTENNLFISTNKRLPNLIAELTNLKFGYSSEKFLLSLNSSLRIEKDMKIWIIWKNWVWKTTLLKIILWEISPLSWAVKINEDLKIWHYSQTMQSLDRNKSIVDEIVSSEVSNKLARSILWSLLIENEKMDQKIWTLSWWEKAKVALTKLILSSPDLIVMDEPTNHLDIDSKEVIKSLLKDFNWVSIITSHDRDFLEETSNLFWVLKDKKINIFYDINKWFDFIGA